MTPEVGALVSPRTRWTAIRRPLAAAFAAGALVVGAATLGSSPAAAAGPAADMPAAVSYLTSQLVDGTHYEFAGGFGPDVGLTIDGGLALAASGLDDASLIAVENFVAANVDSYVGIGAPWGIGGGQAGKSALFAESLGLDPRAFGGQDLIALLASVTCTGPDPSSTVNCPAAGSYYNVYSVVSQALGLMAQLRAGETAAAASPLAYLLSLQNPDGGFASMPSGGTSDVGTTAVAAMALALSSDPAAGTALTDALAWIAGQQLPSGGFPGDAGESVNSAGLAIQALSLNTAAYSVQIDATQAFLLAQQNTDGGFFATSTSHALGSDVRASTQAVSGAMAISFGVLRHVPVAPTTSAPSDPPASDPTTSTPPASDPGAQSAPAPIPAAADATTLVSTMVPASAAAPQLAATGSSTAPIWAWAVACLVGGVGFVLISRVPARASVSRGRRH